MTKRRKRLIVVGAVAVAVAAGVLVYLYFHQREYPFTISRQTTVLLGPVHADGKTINYVAGLNQIYGEGATGENNAAVLLVQAFGPELIEDDIRDETCALLGLATPPPEGAYFVTFDDYLKARGSWQAQSAPSRPGLAAGRPSRTPQEVQRDNLNKAMAGPWTAGDYPVVDAWLKANEQPLAVLAAAARRPRYHVPSVSTGRTGTLFDVLLPELTRYRSAARALAARAMRKVNSWDVDGALADLAACHRLGRLVGQGPTIIERLVGIGIASLATSSTRALAASGRLKAAQIEKVLAELEALPPLAGFAEVVDRAERFMALDLVGGQYRRYKSRHVDQRADPLAGMGFGGEMPNVSVDWDRAMRTINSWYDRAVSAFGAPTFVQRTAAFARLAQQTRQLDSELRQSRGLLSRLRKALGDDSASLRAAYRRDPGKVVLAIMIPSLSRASQLHDRAAMEFHLTRLALALAAHKAETGRYPESLAALAPKYLKELPEDLFVNQPLKYRRQGGGYVLYSVGPNMVDDGGKELDAQKDVADIVVRVE